jgi:hypothetical protein
MRSWSTLIAAANPLSGLIMSSSDLLAWGGILLSTGLAIGFFVLTILVKRLSVPMIFLTLAFACGLIVWGGVLLSWSWKSLTPPDAAVPPANQVITRPAVPNSSLEQIFPPEAAIDVRPSLGTNAATFTLSNWVSWGASSIDVTTWIKAGNTLSPLGRRHYDYLGTGDTVTLSETTPASSISTLAVCLSYLLNKHRVEVIHFFSNSERQGFRKLRESVSQVDGKGNLCDSMPSAAARLL